MTEMAGMPGFAGSELVGNDASLDSYVNGLVWRLPRELQVDDTFLRWDRRPEQDVLVRPSGKMLEDFVKLADAPPERILAYAEQWGPLWLCEHGVHWRLHGPDCYPRTDPDAGQWWCWDREYLDHWRKLAAEARAVLKIAQALNSGELPDIDDWKAIPGQSERIQRLFTPLDEGQWISKGVEKAHEARVTAGDDLELLEQLDEQLNEDERASQGYLDPEEAYRWELELGAATVDIHRRLLGLVLEAWLARTGVQPAMYANGAKLSVRLGGYGLYGALAIQLLFNVCRTDGLAVCRSCGTPYIPSRKPRSDRNAYCFDCGRKAAVRDAAARYRRSDKYQEARVSQEHADACS